MEKGESSVVAWDGGLVVFRCVCVDSWGLLVVVFVAAEKREKWGFEVCFVRATLVEVVWVAGGDLELGCRKIEGK
ncbi:hypothetical protein KY290_026067 [Solanum tuberosum]|uniref:Transmembrane protein n=1 Tax=Solanum tuberosum TaxID=4113 RepID=A0ABQ7UXF4_SOLTU|nr:hypothetical protein KY289_025129 [Solanum tuberosum]KAH0673835.1 hypothetical protein KY284_024922 [Solanum tuberosum]KAH0677149.1 hypothetical protein KY285_024950 [Solanum tuberosum]KAH0755797.1 hypothetical protein KY290_026067 [Solanum tuberosum]